MLPLLLFITLPHIEEIAPGVWANGFSDKHKSSNTGWFVSGDQTVLVDLPPAPIDLAEYTAAVQKIAGHPVRSVIYTGGAVRRELPSGVGGATQSPGVRAVAGGALLLQDKKVLFAGKTVSNGPRAALTGTDTAGWVTTINDLMKLSPQHVVPAAGSWGDGRLLGRQRRFLTEIRRQVGYAISMGRSLETIQREVLLPASYYTWMPYDLPSKEDIRHVYQELTAPQAPFYGKRPTPGSALVLIADRFHEPEHLEAGLRPVLEKAGVQPWFTVDVAALNAANLSQVDLLVILRDGMLWPDGPDKPYKIWMTPTQEKAVVDFVEGGKAFLNLHNSMGLYPENGPYLNLVGGRYIGHGPLERFRVEVVDPKHPITEGISAWSAADEQHTPPFDDKKAHLLLRNRSDDGKTAAAGWAYEPGRGRLCHLASGHTRDALEHPMFRRLLSNAVEWCLRRR